MADFDFGEFLRQKRIQDAVNAHDPSYNPDDSAHWIAAAQKIQSPVMDQPADQGQPEFPDATQSAPQTPQFQAPVIGPKETAYRDKLAQTPLRSDYHPGMLRRIVGGIAGVGAGLNTSNPQIGMDTVERVTNAPFYQKLQEFNQGLGVQKTAAEQEIGDVSRAATQAELVARRQAEEERAAAERARRDEFIYRTSPTAHERKLEELAVQHPGTNAFHEAKLKDGSLVYLKRDNQTGRLINTDTNLPVDMSAIDTLSDPNKSLKQTQDEKIPAALQAGIKAHEIVSDPKQQGTPAFEAAQEYLKNLSQGKDPKTAFDAVKDKTNDERKAKGLPEMSSSELTSLAKQLQPAQGPFLIDPNTNTLMRGQPGQVLPPGTIGVGAAGQQSAKKQKEAEEMQADKDFVNGYIERGVYTGPDDEALLERFFNATKPSTGFRMNQAQIKLLTDLRSLKSRVKAGVGRLTGGTLFDDKQRREIANTINQIIDSKTRASGNPVSAPATSNDGWSVRVVK